MNTQKIIEQILSIIKNLDTIDIEKYKSQIFYLVKNIIENMEFVPEEGTMSYLFLLITIALTVIAYLTSHVPVETVTELPFFLKDAPLENLNSLFNPLFNDNIFSNLKGLSSKDSYIESIAYNSVHDFVVNFQVSSIPVTQFIMTDGVWGNLMEPIHQWAHLNPEVFITDHILPITNLPGTLHLLPHQLLMIPNEEFVGLTQQMAQEILNYGSFQLIVTNLELINYPLSTFEINYGGIEDLPRLTATMTSFQNDIEADNAEIQIIMATDRYINAASDDEREAMIIERIFLNQARERSVLVIQEVINIVTQTNN